MIQINGVSYSGSSISVNGNKIIIDGKDVTMPDTKEITIKVEGNIEFLKVDYCKTISVLGDINSFKSGSGDITCNTIHNGVTTGSGDIDSSNITGNVRTGSGNVSANSISGDVNTGSGNIKYKKN